jgi:hypothetical protein
MASVQAKGNRTDLVGQWGCSSFEHFARDFRDSVLGPGASGGITSGRCPVLAVPSGFTASGMPSGVQIVGQPFDDLTVLRVGATLGRARSWLDWGRRRPALG